MGNKISKIYVGTNQVRPVQEPGGRTPGASTLAYWELNGNGNDTKNDYGVTTYTSTNFNSDGYVGAGNPTYTTGRNGKQCAVFDGTRGLQLPTTLCNFRTNTITISAWVNYTSAEAGNFGTGSSIFQLNSDWSRNGVGRCLFNRIKSNGTYAPVFVATTNSTGQYGQTAYELTGTSLGTGTWHNVVFTFNAGTAKSYIDGVLVETKTTSSKPYLRYTTPNTPSFIGVTKEWSNGDYYSYLTGKIQDVIYENKVWTDQEVADYYANY